MITTTKHPYEFLVRWRDGKLSGAHVGFELTTTEDGTALSTTALPVMAVDIGQGAGFPLADILSQVHVDALTDRDAAQAAQVESEAACAQHEATIADLQAKLDASEAAAAILKNKVDAIEASEVTEK